jgi:flagellar hook assembly protein FlgD
LLLNNEFGVWINSASLTLTGNRILSPRQYGIFTTNEVALNLTGNVIEHGLYFRDGNPGTVATGNIVSGFAQFPLRLSASMLAPFVAANEMVDLNASAQIELVGDRLRSEAVWENLGPPYVVVNAPIEVWQEEQPVTLTLSAGVTLKFDDRSYLFVGNGSNQPGTLIVQGTAEAPVVFTSVWERPRPGDWHGIEIRQGASNASLLDYAVVEFGQNNIAIDNASPTILNSTIRFAENNGIAATNFTLADVRNNEITGNRAYGISLSNFANLRIRGNTIEHGIMTGTSGDTSQPVITENRFVNYRGAFLVKIPFVSASGDLRSNRFEGSDADSHILLYGAETDLTLGLTLPNLGLPYVVVERSLNINRGGFLSIEPGVELRFNRGLGLNVGDDGRLVAIGTREAPILFTGADADLRPGAWDGIFVGSRRRSFLEGCTIRYAGSSDLNFGAVHFSAPSNLESVSVLRNCRVEHSLAHGVTVDRTQPVILQNQFLANGGFDLYNIPSNDRREVTAVINWWGSSAGPNGTGDDPDNKVSEAVRANPWLAAPTALFETVDLIAPQFSPEGGQGILLARLSTTATWTMTVAAPDGDSIVSISGHGTEIVAGWDGRANGSSLDAGAYPFHVIAQPEEGEESGELAGSFEITPALPIAAILDPAVGASVIAGPVRIRGAADPTSYRLEYAPVAMPETRTIITEVLGSTTGGLDIEWDATSLPGGDYILYLTTENSAGQRATTRRPIHIDSIVITNVTLDRHDLDPQSDNTVTIAYELSEAASVTVTFGEHAAVGGELQTAGPHTATWDGRDADGNPVEDGAYFAAVEAVTADGRRGVYVEPAAALPVQMSALSVIQNEVDGTLQVTYAPTQPVDIVLAYGTPPQSGATGILATVVAHEPRAPGLNAEIWQYGQPEDFTPRPLYHVSLVAIASSGGGGGGGGGDGAVAVLAFPDFPVHVDPPPPASPPRDFNPRSDYLVDLEAWSLPTSVVIVRTPSFDVKPVFAEPPVIIPTLGQAAEIRYTLTHAATVSVEISSEDPVTGLARIRTLLDGAEQTAGVQSVLWDGRDDSGLVVNTQRYIYVITAVGPNGETVIRRGTIRVAF